MLPAKLAAQAAGARGPGDRRVAGGAARLRRLGAHRARRAPSSPSGSARRRRAPRSSRRSPASRSASSRSASSSGPSRARSSASRRSAIVMLTYFGRVRFRGGSPAGSSPSRSGTLLAWVTGIAPVGAAPGSGPASRCPSRPSATSSRRCAADLLAATSRSSSRWGSSTSSARCRTSSRPRRPATPTRRARRSLVNGLGTLAAALFGSCFPTTIYIGHPGLEGARRARRLLDPERRVRHRRRAHRARSR